MTIRQNRAISNGIDTTAVTATKTMSVSSMLNIVDTDSEHGKEVPDPDHNTSQSHPPRARSETAPDSEQTDLTEYESDKCRHI